MAGVWFISSYERDSSAIYTRFMWFFFFVRLRFHCEQMFYQSHSRTINCRIELNLVIVYMHGITTKFPDALSVPPISFSYYVLWTVPRRMNIKLPKSMRDPFSQFLLEFFAFRRSNNVTIQMNCDLKQIKKAFFAQMPTNCVRRPMLRNLIWRRTSWIKCQTIGSCTDFRSIFYPANSLTPVLWWFENIHQPTANIVCNLFNCFVYVCACVHSIFPYFVVPNQSL